MRNKLSILLLLCGSFLLAQQTRETVVVPRQLEPLALGEVIYGNGTINIKGKLPATLITYNPTDGTFTADDVAEALDANRSAIAALQAGGSDGVAESVAITGTTVKTVTIARSVGANLTGTFTDEVDDADADPANELQTLSTSGKFITSSPGGGSVSKIDPIRTEAFTPGSGTTITIPSSPDVSQISNIRIYRGPVRQTVATSGTAADVTVAGATLTFNYRAFDGTEQVTVEYVEN